MAGSPFEKILALRSKSYGGAGTRKSPDIYIRLSGIICLIIIAFITCDFQEIGRELPPPSDWQSDMVRNPDSSGKIFLTSKKTI